MIRDANSDPCQFQGCVESPVFIRDGFHKRHSQELHDLYLVDSQQSYPRFRDKVVSPEVQCRHVSIFPSISYLSKCISRDLYAPKVFSKIESNPSWEKIDYHQWGAKMNQLGIQILSIALPAPSMVHQFRHLSCTHQIRVCFPVRGGDKISHRGWISGPTQPREKMSSYD